MPNAVPKTVLVAATALPITLVIHTFPADQNVYSILTAHATRAAYETAAKTLASTPVVRTPNAKWPTMHQSVYAKADLAATLFHSVRQSQSSPCRARSIALIFAILTHAVRMLNAVRKTTLVFASVCLDSLETLTFPANRSAPQTPTASTVWLVSLKNVAILVRVHAVSMLVVKLSATILSALVRSAILEILLSSVEFDPSLNPSSNQNAKSILIVRKIRLASNSSAKIHALTVWVFVLLMPNAVSYNTAQSASALKDSLEIRSSSVS